MRRFVALEGQSRGTLEQLGDFKRALDAAAIVATTDVKGRITYVNDKFLEISGYSREELLGQDHRIINSAYHSAEFIRDLWRTIANGQVWHGEIRNRAKDGHFYWVDTTIVPFVNEDGKPYQYIAIRADVTARKAAEDTLTHQAALARVGQMAAVLAHEVRNPLAGIRGAMQVLLGRRKADDPERAVMQEILARTESLNELIDDLLLFARPRPPRPAEVELAPLLHDVFATMQPGSRRPGRGVRGHRAAVDGAGGRGSDPGDDLQPGPERRPGVGWPWPDHGVHHAGAGRDGRRCRYATRALASRRRFESRSSSRSSRPSRAAVASGWRSRSGRWNCTAARCRCTARRRAARCSR